MIRLGGVPNLPEQDQSNLLRQIRHPSPAGSFGGQNKEEKVEAEEKEDEEGTTEGGNLFKGN